MAPEDSQSAFVRRLDEHRGIVFKVSDAYCRNRTDREDLVQNIVMELWRAYRRFDQTRSFSTWMYRVALNVAISFARNESRRTSRVVAADASFLETVAETLVTDSDDRLDLVRNLLDELSSLDRALMILYLDDNSYATIADVLGITQTNVATKLNRIKGRIKQRIAATHPS